MNIKPILNNVLIFAVVVFTTTSIFAQKMDSFKSKFEEANVLMEDKYFPFALEIWLELLQEQPDNANINSKIGMCYYYSPTHQVQGLKYFEKALSGVTSNYDPFMWTETGAKLETYYYYAHTLHLNYELDKAIEYFSKFKETAHKKHILQESASRQIEMCNNAKRLIEIPDDVIISNLGDKINSMYSEHSPVFSLDESEIFFTSRRLRADSTNINFKEETTGEYYEDVYVSYKDLTGEWSDPELLNFNRANQHHATIALSADNQTLYLYQDDDGDGNLYQSTLLGDRWSRPEKMNDYINSKSYETHLTISVDGKTMYFTSDRKGGLGGKDIYMSRKLPNGEWGEAINVGAPINTKYDEECPYFHPDGKTLYFSSTGHESMGGYDIFFSELQDDGTWSSPINIGYPINSTHDDIFYITTPDGKRAYYASFGGNQNVGEKDIYVIEQKDAKDKALTLLKGHINAPEGETLPDNIMVYLTDNETGELVGEAKPIARTGSYVFIIPPGKNYNISYEADGTEIYNENIYVPEGSEYNEISKEILLDAVHLTGEEIIAEKTVDNNKYTVQFKKLEGITSNITMKCVDSDGNMLFETKASENGSFSFNQLPADENYMFMFYDEDGKMINCDEIEIELFENKTHRAFYSVNSDCAFTKAKVGRVSFANLPTISDDLIVQYIDDDGNVVYSEKVDKDGFFKYHELQKDYSKIKLMGNAPCQESIMKVVDEETKNITFIQFTNETDCDFIPLGTVKKPVFEEFFTYNKNVPQKEKDLANFIEQAMKVYNSEGKLNISIESSASKVPTKTFSSNEELTKLRAQNIKETVNAKLKEKGVNTDKVKYVDVTTLVQGPSYKGDYIDNKSTYEKYQYVKVKIK